MNLSVKGLARAVVAAAAGAGLVTGAMQVSGAAVVGPTSSADAVREGSTSTVRSSAVVCPGPELKGVEGLKDLPVGVTVAAAAAPERALTGLKLPTQDGSVTISGMPGGGKSSPATARGAVASKAFSAAGAAVVSGQQALAPGLAATQQWLVASGDHRGLGTVACGRPVADAWLLAGAGQPGRQERLVLTNPGSNAVTVDVTLHGSKGRVESPNGQGIVVPARARTSVLVDSISGSETSPAVHIAASGGMVHAVLNDYWLDGSIAAGSDDVVPAAAPSRDQVIPAVSIGGRATLRVAVPGDGEAVVQARALTPTGPKALPKGAVTRLPGGTVRDIDLAGLPTGNYGIQVRADVPVVAAAMVQRRSAPAAPGDLAWSSSTEPVTGVAGAPLPAVAGKALGRALSLVSTADSVSAEVVTIDTAGRATSRRVTVKPDHATTLPLTGATSVWVHRLSGKGQLRTGVVSWTQDAQGVLLSSMPLADASLLTTSAGLVELPQ